MVPKQLPRIFSKTIKLSRKALEIDLFVSIQMAGIHKNSVGLEKIVSMLLAARTQKSPSVKLSSIEI